MFLLMYNLIDICKKHNVKNFYRTEFSCTSPAHFESTRETSVRFNPFPECKNLRRAFGTIRRLFGNVCTTSLHQLRAMQALPSLNSLSPKTERLPSRLLQMRNISSNNGAHCNVQFVLSQLQSFSTIYLCAYNCTVCPLLLSYSRVSFSNMLFYGFCC